MDELKIPDGNNQPHYKNLNYAALSVSYFSDKTNQTVGGGLIDNLHEIVGIIATGVLTFVIYSKLATERRLTMS